MICMADAAWGTQYAAPSIPQRLTSRLSPRVNGCFIVWIPPDEKMFCAAKKYASPDFVRERRTTTKPDLPAAHGSETPTANCRQVRRPGHAPPGCGTIVACRAHVWSVRCTVSAFPAGYAVRQVFRLGQFIVPGSSPSRVYPQWRQPFRPPASRGLPSRRRSRTGIAPVSLFFRPALRPRTPYSCFVLISIS